LAVESVRRGFEFVGDMQMRMSLFAGALAAALAGAASADAESPWYISVDGGGYFRASDTKQEPFQESFPPFAYVPGHVSLSFSPGWTVHLAVGRYMTPRLRLEAELGVADYSSSKTSYAPNSASAGNALAYPVGGYSLPALDDGGDPHYQRITEGVNLYYDLPKLPLGLTPYVGLGGGVWEGRSDRTLQIAAGPYPEDYISTYSGGNSTVGGYGMVEGGLAFRLSRHLSIVPSYRFQVSSPAGYFPFTNTKDTHYEIANIAKMALRYRF
jgi:hypothetical protein